jgi:uncharacterized integral membrane protein
MKKIWGLRYLSYAVTGLFLLVLILFATSNKDDVRVDFFPLPDAVFSGPLYLLVFVVVFAGFVLGAFVAWNTGRTYRRAARQANRRVATLEGELAAMRLRAEAAEERFAQMPRVEPAVEPTQA